MGCRTQKIKALADVRPIAIDDADSIIRTFHLSLADGTAEGEVTVDAPLVAPVVVEAMLPEVNSNGDKVGSAKVNSTEVILDEGKVM